MPLFRRPSEEELTVEHEEQETKLAETTAKFEIRLSAYTSGTWKWDIYKNDTYIDSGNESSRSDAITKAQTAATSYAERTTPVVRERFDYVVEVKGTLKQ